jgi:hypothetical protein
VANLIHNERTKLLATALNNTAVATLVTAIIAPVVGLLYGTPILTATKMVAFRRSHLAFGRSSPTCRRASRPQEAARMTDLQLYLIIAPLVLLAIGWGAAFWWIHRPDPEEPRTH